MPSFLAIKFENQGFDLSPEDFCYFLNYSLSIKEVRVR